jgi:GNAT superfamily N-acetyltransferase
MWKRLQQLPEPNKPKVAADWSRFQGFDVLEMSMVDLAKANNLVFQGYPIPINHTAEGFAAFCRILSMDFAQSVILRQVGGKLAGIAMLGVRGDEGWCGGFGIAPEFRGRRLAALLLSALIESARTAHIDVLRLEVLEENEPALRTYRQGGFRVERTVAVMAAQIDRVFDTFRWKACPICTVEEVGRADAVHMASAIKELVRPTWQRELATISQVNGLKAVQALKYGRTQALLLYREDIKSGSITVDHCVFDDPSAAIRLLEAVSRHGLMPDNPLVRPEIVAINEPLESPLYDLLLEIGFIPQDRQLEMYLRLGQD